MQDKIKFKTSSIIMPFVLLIEAFKNCWDEIWKSVFVMAVLTVILATIFYLVESPLQPEYANWWHDVVWAFCVYIQDPGGIGGDGPITDAGRIVATILGFLNILIVAVPAGIIASGFTTTLEDDKKDKVDAENAKKVKNFFARKQNRETKRRYVLPYATIPALQARCMLGAWHLAKYDNFNYVSKEVDLDTDNPQSFYVLQNP